MQSLTGRMLPRQKCWRGFSRPVSRQRFVPSEIRAAFADIVSTAKGFGSAAVEARTRQEIQAAFSKALETDGPTVIAIPIKHQIRPLVPPVSVA
jgi:thiamine pyrophosphate-dependent acetolactate synthase large subunit-like protein